MKASGEWFEDEGFWTAYAALMFDEKRWAEVPAVVDALERLVPLPRGASILDSCCGPGRHSLELASRGYRVTGLDITGAYLDAARESAEAWKAQIEFVQGDLRRFVRPSSFDLALNLFTSFGYFATPEEDAAALRNLRLSLREGGTLVLETNGKETAARDFIEGEWFERGDATIMTEYSVVGDWEGLRNRWIVMRRDAADPGAASGIVDRSFVLRLYSATELARAMREAGFSSVRIFGGLDGSPYDQSARSLIAVARA